ncbi:hypothetical protein ACWGPQ_05225 [Saccharomonospora azurea]
MGALLGLALFFGVVFAVRFFDHGHVGLGVLSTLVAATPVAILVHGAVRNRRRSLSRPAVQPRPRRSTLVPAAVGGSVLLVLLVVLLVLTW